MKGVVVKILKDHEMPMDSDGNYADVVMYAKSLVARLNPGQEYTCYINAASRDMSKWIKSVYNGYDVGLDVKHYHGSQTSPIWIRDSYNTEDGFYCIWDRLISYYEVASPQDHDKITKNYLTHEDKVAHVEHIVKYGIYLTVPADSPHLNKDIFSKIEKVISPTYGPVTYVDDAGNRVVTKDNAFIGVQQMIVLEKSDLHPMSASSGNIQHHGLIAGPNKSTINAHPSKQQCVKAFSETEERLYAATAGGVMMAELIDYANNPDAHKRQVRNLLDSSTPSRLEYIKRMFKRNPRPISFIKSVLFGFGLVIKKYDDMEDSE